MTVAVRRTLDSLTVPNYRRYFAGQIVAMIVAETFEKAQHAAEALEIEYPLRVVRYELVNDSGGAGPPPFGLAVPNHLRP